MIYRVILIVLVGVAGFFLTMPVWGQEALAPGWTIVDEGTTDGPSAWSMSGGLITQGSNIYGDVGSATDPQNPGTFIATGDPNWSDYRIRVDVRSRDDDAIGIMFRYLDGDNYYRFSMDKQRAYRRLIKKVGGEVIVLAEDAVAYVQDQWYTLKVEVNGNKIIVSLSDEPVFDISDDSLKSGKIALYSWGNIGCEFENLLVESETGILYSSVDLKTPTIEFLAPTNTDSYDSSAASLDMAGTASDDKEVSAVSWESSHGENGMATGTANWAISGIPLTQGENIITVTATDKAGNRGSRTLTVKYTPASEVTPVAEEAQSVESPALPAENYIIDPGDVLDISVWKDEALTKVVTVLPDGKIAFPLIGEIVAQGKTVVQLTDELKSKISPFVPDPEITVVIQQTNSMLIYVIGKVNKPGRFAFNVEVDVLQALAMAGGFNPFAKRNKVKIFRRIGDQTQIFEFKYDEVSKGKELEQNIILGKGDVIVVP